MMIMGCCGGPRPDKKYSLKEYLISIIAITAFVLIIYFLTK
jgi:hypothetical protein